ncbi:hypothetical protein C8N47_12328 [Mangrovibacterium marinum]|uniref:Uncharacterized protein n=1 Tax=Mangrovibacterium marinum TaxID=1639118 RepID=A0A2T5BXZ1_9BACT|nr:hypothetical protein C8N47_12328 [Mangrovibacterium marinum]
MVLIAMFNLKTSFNAVWKPCLPQETASPEEQVIL